jgi:hypothetical protein
MRNRIGILLGIALALAAAAGLAWGATARPRKVSPQVKALLQSETFVESGRYSGMLAGTMTLNGAVYRVAPHAATYEIGRGMLPARSVVHERNVSLFGAVRGKTKIVHQIVVRPAMTYRALGVNARPVAEVTDRERPD